LPRDQIHCGICADPRAKIHVRLRCTTANLSAEQADKPFFPVKALAYKENQGVRRKPLTLANRF
jgi:hypothetical protein